MTPEQIKIAIEIASVIGTIIMGFAALIWKVSRYFHHNNARLSNVATVVKNLAETVTKLDRSIVAMKTSLERHEKDVLKLEGVSDATRRDLLEVVKTLERTTSKIEAMWLTLQRLFPDKVPSRVVDRQA